MKPALTVSRLRIGSIVCILTLWFVFAAFFPSQQVPNPIDLLVVFSDIAAGTERYSLPPQYSITLQRILLSSVLILLCGIPLGILMGLSERIQKFLHVYIVILFAVPSIVCAFIIAIWFGITTYIVPILVCFIITFPYVATILWKAMADLNPELLEMADAFNAGSKLRWRFVILPYLIPGLLTATRTTISVVWKVVLVAELFATQSGLGYVINTHFLSLRNDLVIAWTLPMFILMFLIEYFIRQIESKVSRGQTSSLNDSLASLEGQA